MSDAYQFAPLMPDESGKRIFLLINEPDLHRIFGRKATSVVTDRRTGKAYHVRRRQNDHVLLDAPEATASTRERTNG